MSIMDIELACLFLNCAGSSNLVIWLRLKGGREGGLNQNEIQNMYIFTIGFSQKAYERLQANWYDIAKDL
jgi:hypothetical protein